MAQFMNGPRRVAMVAMVLVGVTAGISSFSIVRAERIVPTNTGTYKCSTGTACVTGSSTGSNTWGVYGLSNVDDGVHGRTNSTNGNSGVAGISNGTTGSAHGVYGRSSNGDGVEGVSTDSLSAGVNGTGGNDGVDGTGGSVGVYGTGTSFGWGVYGSSKQGVGVLADSEGSGTSYSGAALVARTLNTKTTLFYAVNLGTTPLAKCEINSVADLTCTGKIGAPSLRERHRNGGGQEVLSYASQSATATIEDVGTARLSGGVANVRIDPAFASVIDHNWYYVFLTPLGDTRGLYVSMKTMRGFQVRETEHGRSSLEFDYRIVAHPLDADSDRLPPAPAIRAPSIMRPGR